MSSSAIATLLAGLVLFAVFGGVWLQGCSDCEARGGVYVAGVSFSGYVCVEAAKKTP